MAFDTFLEFPKPAQAQQGPIKVAGESKDQAHPNLVPVNSFAFGIENPTTIGSTSGGAGAGKAKFNTLQLTKPVDSASPSLYSAAGLGVHFPEAVLYLRKAGTQADFLIYRFSMVFVSKVDWEGSSGDEQPQERVDFVYGAMQVNYVAMQPNGQPSKPALAGWSQVSNSTDYTVPIS